MCWTCTLPELATVYQTKTAPPAPSAINGGKLPNCSEPSVASSTVTGSVPQRLPPSIDANFCANIACGLVKSSTTHEAIALPSASPCRSARPYELGPVTVTPVPHRGLPLASNFCTTMVPSEADQATTTLPSPVAEIFGTAVSPVSLETKMPGSPHSNDPSGATFCASTWSTLLPSL